MFTKRVPKQIYVYWAGTKTNLRLVRVYQNKFTFSNGAPKQIYVYFEGTKTNLLTFTKRVPKQIYLLLLRGYRNKFTYFY